MTRWDRSTRVLSLIHISQLELLVPFNLFLDFGDLSFVIESLTALRRKPLYHRKRVFEIDYKLDLVMNLSLIHI